MDKGFFSTKNINYLLDDTQHNPINFLISVPFTSSFAKKQVESERKDIDCVEKTIVINGSPMRAITKERSFNGKHKVYTHIYYSAKKAGGIREELFTHIAELKEQATTRPEKFIDNEEHRKYLIIRKSEKSENGYTINIKTDVVEKALATAGWVVLIASNIYDAKKAMCIYRDKDVVEKG